MITAVVTNYNKPPSIVERCIRSIEDHGLKYIIVDDGSDDRSHLKKYDRVVELEKNVGTYKAFEIGLALVDTKYVMRVDSDDYIVGVPDVSSGCDAYVNTLNRKVSLNPEEFLRRPYAGLNGITVKTEILKREWYSYVRYAADIIIYMRLIRRYKCCANKDDLYVYDRQHSNISTMAKRNSHLEFALAIAEVEFKKGYADE
jgi:glycosyltransferase involved in cell wall biosynthesis